MRAVSQWHRIAAFTLDYLAIALYIGVLVAFNLTIGKPLTEAVGASWQAQLLGFTTLTLPVILYFALSECFAGGTLGKRTVGLHVTTAGGQRPTLGQTLFRNALKFLPWELAHTALYRMVGPLAPQELPVWPFVFSSASVVLALVYLLRLFMPSHHPPYERLSGTLDIPAPARTLKGVRS